MEKLALTTIALTTIGVVVRANNKKCKLSKIYFGPVKPKKSKPGDLWFYN